MNLQILSPLLNIRVLPAKYSLFSWHYSCQFCSVNRGNCRICQSKIVQFINMYEYILRFFLLTDFGKQIMIVSCELTWKESKRVIN